MSWIWRKNEVFGWWTTFTVSLPEHFKGCGFWRLQNGWYTKNLGPVWKTSRKKKNFGTSYTAIGLNVVCTQSCANRWHSTSPPQESIGARQSGHHPHWRAPTQKLSFRCPLRRHPTQATGYQTFRGYGQAQIRRVVFATQCLHSSRLKLPPPEWHFENWNPSSESMNGVLTTFNTLSSGGPRSMINRTDKEQTLGAHTDLLRDLMSSSFLHFTTVCLLATIPHEMTASKDVGRKPKSLSHTCDRRQRLALTISSWFRKISRSSVNYLWYVHLVRIGSPEMLRTVNIFRKKVTHFLATLIS